MKRNSAFLLQCEPIPCVRIALIGLGKRGMKTLARYAQIPHAEICCIVDIDPLKLEKANEALEKTMRPHATAFCGRDAWKDACMLESIDLVYICTEWNTHAEMAIYAMRHGKHVAVEVPAVTTIEECHELVRTAEETRRHCFMTENCCYDVFALQTFEMHRRGFFGKITHCEGAYIHDLTPDAPDSNTPGHDATSWIERSCINHGGNPYPTHAIGPIAMLLGFHRHDRMHHLVSITSDGAYENQLPLGRVNTTLIKTANGVSIMLQLDVTTHRPYSRLQTICGTNGYAQKYPLVSVQGNGMPCLAGKEAESFMQQFSTSEESRIWQQGCDLGVPNAMNYTMDMRLIHCLHHGLPLDMDVYDAAEWSRLAELTQASAKQGCQPLHIPEFLPQ